jgi:hypothetical protein
MNAFGRSSIGVATTTTHELGFDLGGQAGVDDTPGKEKENKNPNEVGSGGQSRRQEKKKQPLTACATSCRTAKRATAISVALLPS